MFSYLVAIFEITMVVSFFTFIPTMLIFRILAAINANKNFKRTLIIAFVPFSFGYYYLLNKKQRLKSYNKIMTFYLIITIIGILFTVFQRLFSSYEFF